MGKMVFKFTVYTLRKGLFNILQVLNPYRDSLDMLKSLKPYMEVCFEPPILISNKELSRIRKPPVFRTQ